MENKQQRESQAPEWVRTWAEFILKQTSNDAKLNEQSINCIEQILVASTQGDSCIEKPEQMPEQLYPLIVSDEQASHQQVAPLVFDDQYLYLYRYWNLEQRLALQVQRLKQQHIDAVDVQPFAHLLEDVHQKSALTMVGKNALNIITGGPGTGKTYTLARIIAVLSQAMPDIRIAMAAPTGKAAQRMKEAMQTSFADEKLNGLGLVSARLKQQDTVTLHRLLGLGTQFKARFNLKQPLPYDVIVIDEASMLDLHLATLLFEAVPDHCRVILLGDANQLASVDVGSVLADLQNIDALSQNRVNLITTRRFKEGARIGKTAQFIQNHHIHSAQILHAFEQQIVTAGKLQSIPLMQGMEDVVQLEYIPDQVGAVALNQYYEKLSSGYQDYFFALEAYMQNGYAEEDVPKVIEAFDHYRILTAIRYGELGLDRLNDEMQKSLLKALPRIIKQGDWYIGRPVMMSYNDSQLGVSNGDIGLCFKHRTQVDLFEVYFPSLDKWLPATRLPKSIQTAFALTIHKSQGSEFMHTAVVLDESATKLLSQELIYTAITRAKLIVSLLVSANALRQALTIKTKRCSGLVNKMNKIVLSNI